MPLISDLLHVGRSAPSQDGTETTESSAKCGTTTVKVAFEKGNEKVRQIAQKASGAVQNLNDAWENGAAKISEAADSAGKSIVFIGKNMIGLSMINTAVLGYQAYKLTALEQSISRIAKVFTVEVEDRKCLERLHGLRHQHPAAKVFVITQRSGTQLVLKGKLMHAENNDLFTWLNPSHVYHAGECQCMFQDAANWRTSQHDSKQQLIFYYFALFDEVFEFSEPTVIPAAVGDCLFLGDFDSGTPIVSIKSTLRFEDTEQPWQIIFRGVYPTSIETKGQTEFLGQIKSDPVREGGVGLAKICLYYLLRYGCEDSHVAIRSLAKQCLPRVIADPWLRYVNVSGTFSLISHLIADLRRLYFNSESPLSICSKYVVMGGLTFLSTQLRPWLGEFGGLALMILPELGYYGVELLTKQKPKIRTEKSVCNSLT